MRSNFVAILPEEIFPLAINYLALMPTSVLFGGQLVSSTKLIAPTFE